MRTVAALTWFVTLLILLVHRAMAQGPTATQLTFHPTDDVHPAWSPDGTQIAFASDRAVNREIWVMPATGEPSATRLTFDPAWDGEPAWSPDGSKIAFTSTRFGAGGLGYTRIWVMPSGGGVATQITVGAGGDAVPSWSPDGSMIAFASLERSGN